MPRTGDARCIRYLVALLTRNAVAKRCVFADLYTCFIYNTLYNRLKLAGSSHILTKFMDAQRRTALIFVTQGLGCVSCMCEWFISYMHDIDGYAYAYPPPPQKKKSRLKLVKLITFEK